MNSADPSSKRQTPTLQEALDFGLQQHTVGDLTKAESIYQQILQTHPNQPDALHLLGVVAYQTGKYDIAVEPINDVLAIKSNFAEAHSNLGILLKMRPLPAITRPLISSLITPRRIAI